MIAVVPSPPSSAPIAKARWTSGRTSPAGTAWSRFVTARPSWPSSREKIVTLRTTSTNSPRPAGSRKRLWITRSSSATDVDSARKTRVSIVFRPTSFAPGISGDRPSVGSTGGAASIAGAGFTRGGLAACDGCFDAGVLQGCLRRGQAGQRHPVGRARDVVEAEGVAEGDALRLAAVLAADAELDLLTRAAAALDRDPHQIPHPALVERLEGVRLQHAVLEVVREELALRVVAREAERRLREVVRPEREEVGVLGDLAGADARARKLDHRPAEVLARLFLLGGADRQLAEPLELLGEADERVHDLHERRVPRPLLDRPRGPHDRTHLHLRSEERRV